MQQLGFISPCIVSSPARLDGIYPVQIHLIRIGDSLDHRSVGNKEFLLKKIYEIFEQTLETVRNREVSAPRGSTVLRGYMTSKIEIVSRQNL